MSLAVTHDDIGAEANTGVTSLWRGLFGYHLTTLHILFIFHLKTTAIEISSCPRPTSHSSYYSISLLPITENPLQRVTCTCLSFLTLISSLNYSKLGLHHYSNKTPFLKFTTNPLSKCSTLHLHVFSQ